MNGVYTSVFQEPAPDTDNRKGGETGRAHPHHRFLLLWRLE